MGNGERRRDSNGAAYHPSRSQQLAEAPWSKLSGRLFSVIGAMLMGLLVFMAQDLLTEIKAINANQQTQQVQIVVNQSNIEDNISALAGAKVDNEKNDNRFTRWIMRLSYKLSGHMEGHSN